MTEIIFKIKCGNRAYADRTIKSALNSFHIKEKIKTIILERDNKLGGDINVDYSGLKSGKIIISFGKAKKITRKIIFHELGHVWDAVHNGLDFSREKFSKRQQIIGSIIVNLSLDGRLEKMGLPHISKSEGYGFFKYANRKFNLGFSDKDFKKFWGARLGKKDVMNAIKNR